MNYYDEILTKINDLIAKNQYEEAFRIIQNELDMPYIPKELEDKLNAIINENKEYFFVKKTLSDEEIEKYLKLDENHQLIAVSQLDTKNLRDYYGIVNDYLKNGTFRNAKVLLIESLIKQDISDEYTMIQDGVEYTFMPRFIELPEESDGFISGNKKLEDYYMKEPSKLIMAKELLYKETIMMLPLNPDENEGNIIADKIIEYINNAFESNNQYTA